MKKLHCRIEQSIKSRRWLKRHGERREGKGGEPCERRQRMGRVWRGEEGREGGREARYVSKGGGGGVCRCGCWPLGCAR